jgi:nucleotide-binding universal stress UspA family protein
MFKNILVPLDGSKLAEAAIPPAVSLAQTLGAPITLLHLIEKDAPQEIHKDRHLRQADEAAAYLKNVANEISKDGLKIETHVHTAEVKDVADSIIRHASEEFNPDLIVMCAHGHSGFRDMVFGNIAQQVLSGGQTPLLLLQPESAESHPFTLRRLLVPLDNESVHDESLHYAQELAKTYKAELYLLTVVPTLGTLTGEEAAVSSMLPATSTAFLDIQEETGKDHLQGHLNDFLKAGYNVNAEIARGDPVEIIVSTAARIGADMILLSTHRKAGMNAFWSRSVAPNVLKKTHLPLLLVPLKE